MQGTNVRKKIGKTRIKLANCNAFVKRNAENFKNCQLRDEKSILGLWRYEYNWHM